MNIDAVMTIPDASNIEISREKNLTSDNTIKLTVSFDVQTYYPAFRKPKLPDILPYEVMTDYLNKTLSIKVDLFKPKPDSNEIDIVYSETHIITTSSDGGVVIPVGSGASLVGSYLGVDLNQEGLKINVGIDSNAQNKYVTIQSGENLSQPSSNINQAFSNAFDTPVGGDYRDIITLPKKTRWYNNLVSLRGNRANTTMPYSNQDLKNQKKI
jgi:hypothetical protein